MRAAVLWSQNEPFVVENVELQAPRQGEVRVKLAASGVCPASSGTRARAWSRRSGPVSPRSRPATT